MTEKFKLKHQNKIDRTVERKKKLLMFYGYARIETTTTQFNIPPPQKKNRAKLVTFAQY